MANSFPFNLNDPLQFPVLNGITMLLDRFTPKKELNIYWNKQYHAENFNGEINKEAETVEQTIKDIKRLQGIIRTATIRMSIAQETSNYFTQLLLERDLFAINIQGSDQREFNIQTYDKYVIENVERYNRFLQQCLDIMYWYVGDNEEIVKLNGKNLFRIWYEKFEVKDNTNKTTKPDVLPNKLKWKGQKNQLYNVLRQLKNKHELIGNSFESLADFLIKNVTGFENTKKETIQTEFKRNKELPKPKRINIEPGESE